MSTLILRICAKISGIHLSASSLGPKKATKGNSLLVFIRFLREIKFGDRKMIGDLHIWIMEFYSQKYLVKSTESSSLMISRNIFRISFSTLWAVRQGEKRPFPHSILAITQICFLKCTFPFHIYYFLTFLYSPFTSPSYTVWKSLLKLHIVCYLVTL